jgi:hypothetical protein
MHATKTPAFAGYAGRFIARSGFFAFFDFIACTVFFIMHEFIQHSGGRLIATACIMHVQRV